MVKSGVLCSIVYLTVSNYLDSSLFSLYFQFFWYLLHEYHNSNLELGLWQAWDVLGGDEVGGTDLC